MTHVDMARPVPRSTAAPVQSPIDDPLTGASPTVVDTADPGPLGLAAFALTTFCLSVFNAHLIRDVSLEAIVLPLALFYGGIGQVLAGMWEFKRVNTFGALAFTSYGAFWLSYAGLVKFVVPGLPAAAVHQGVGLFLLSWTIFTGYMTFAAARINAALLAVFVAATLTFSLLTIGALGQASLATRLGGWFGLLTAALAWYTSAAGVINSTWQRTVLPLVPLAPVTLG